MPDREKILKQLAGIGIALDMDGHHADAQCVRDAINLLREQEPVEPKWRKGYAYCSQCGYKLHWIADRNNFCPNCGRAVKWDADGA